MRTPCELGFLWQRVSAAGVAVDPREASAVRDWPAPTSNAELPRVRVIGVCSRYRTFVDDYADIRVAAPLARLCGPHAPWQCYSDAEEQRSFDRLEHCLATAVVLRTFDSDCSRRSILTTEASEVAVSAVLTQADSEDDGHHHTVAYESRKLAAAEPAYAHRLGASKRIPSLPPSKGLQQ